MKSLSPRPARLPVVRRKARRRRPGPARGRPARLASVTAVAALALGGCSVGSGAPSTSLRLLVSEDFGAVTIDDLDAPRSASSDTVLRLLQRNEKVGIRDGGSGVRSIAGRAGGTENGRPYDWFYYVNGVESEKGAASERIRPSDRIWWDRHDRGAARRIPAVVGSFPEPFLHGIDGKRLPTRLECTGARSSGCVRASKHFADAGIVVGRGRLQGSFAQETNRVIVGTWAQVRADETARTLEDGPSASGVYARPTKDGRSIDILDPRGKVARTLGPGSGLIAATRFEGGQPVWIITGTDDAGLTAAAEALEEGNLGGHFALAVAGGQAVDVPFVRREAPDARGQDLVPTPRGEGPGAPAGAPEG